MKRLSRKMPSQSSSRLYRKVNALEETDDGIRRGAREELVRASAGGRGKHRQSGAALSSCPGGNSRDSTASWGFILMSGWAKASTMTLWHLSATRLTAQGVAEMSEGALCIFFRDIPPLADKPVIIRKSDGGFLYATTDLATIDYRVKRWNPSAIWYVVGAPQSLHFQQIFAAARRMGVTANLRHIAFGSILGEDRKIMRTRTGENVGLAELLDEAIERAKAIVAEKPASTPQDAEEIARTIGLGAVKYAELSQHRMTDYVFAWDKMLSFQGNTAPYLQNAYVRIRSIFRKLDGGSMRPRFRLWKLAEERALAIKLLQFGEIVPLVLEDFRPNLLANYLYDLAVAFHAFYEACPVLKADGAERRSSRLVLCEVTGSRAQQGSRLARNQMPREDVKPVGLRIGWE